MKKGFIITLSIFCNFSLFSQIISIPFYINEKKRIVLDYSIKGQKVKLVFDTGTEMNFIDIKIADNINFMPNRNVNHTAFSTFGGLKFDVITPNGLNKGDSIFNSAWVLTDIKKTRNVLGLGEDVDGFVGFDWKNFNNILELDFKDKQLRIWKNLPPEYLKKTKYVKVNLFEPNHNRETTGPKIYNIPISIQGSLTVVDSLHYDPYFILDSGSDGYSLIAVFDSLLLKKMVTFKKDVKEKYGNNYPTTHLLLPELGIDSLYVNLAVNKKSYYENENTQVFGNYKIGGFLGIEFFLKYEKVLFDCRNRMAYFIKK
jgi:hypothetical protein